MFVISWTELMETELVTWRNVDGHPASPVRHWPLD
jgi:hypothetical protein